MFYINCYQSLLRIQGSINSQLQEIQTILLCMMELIQSMSKISHQLEHYNKGSVIALGLIINSQGGCPYQVEVLSKKIKSYLNGLPLYTFATEQSLGNAYQLLQLGNKSYAQNTSKIGFTQMYKNKLNFAEFLQNYGINTLYTIYNLFSQLILNLSQIFALQSNTHLNHNFVVNQSIRANTLQDMNYLDQYYGSKTKQVTDQCWTNRKELIKINKEQLENNVFLGKEAKDLGLVDELGTYEKVLMQQYPKAKIIPINTEGKLTEYENWFNLFIKISQSRGFLGLVLLFGVKVMVKWGLIIYVWRQSVKQRKLNKQLESQQQ